jgi:hypothetical protein
MAWSGAAGLRMFGSRPGEGELMVDEAIDAFNGDEPDEHHRARHGGDCDEQRPAEGVLPDIDELFLAFTAHGGSLQSGGEQAEYRAGSSRRKPSRLRLPDGDIHASSVLWFAPRGRGGLRITASRSQAKLRVMPAAVDHISPFPRCAACGEVVGVYERAVMVLEGGGLAHGSLLALNDRDARDLYHEPCFPLQAVPG